MDEGLIIIIFRAMMFFSIALFVVGVFKPEWFRVRQKEPSRMTILGVAIGLFIVGVTGAGTNQFAEKSNVEAVNRGKMIGQAVYEVDNSTRRCEPGTKPGNAGSSNDEQTPAGIRYMVKTPANYNSHIAHPLLMVYAPAGRNRYESEDYMYLTQAGTAAGFVVAYADHRTMTPKAIEELAEIPGLIEKKWCIDTQRIFLTGHSDGGTVAMGIAFLAGTKHIPAAIAPSAVGIRGDDLKEQSCPGPLPVMVMHSSRDTHFPGYGKETIEWWSACNGCDTAGPVRDGDGCVTYGSCKNNVTTRYCEGTGTHPEWPGNNQAIIDFFKVVNK
jgi:polyhydroxybutyrate depolymerase